MAITHGPGAAGVLTQMAGAIPPHCAVELLQAQPPRVDAAWTMHFETWQPESRDYADVDAELRMQLTTLYFFCNRPTLGALMGIGGDLSDAFKGPQSAAKGQTASGGLAQPNEAEDESPFSDEASGGPRGAAALLLAFALASTECRQVTNDLAFALLQSRPHSQPMGAELSAQCSA